MERITIQRIIDDKRAARIEYDKYSVQLMTCNNGYQWSGSNIGSIEVAEAAIEVLQEYIESQKNLTGET